MTDTVPEGSGALARLWAVARQRCPRCFRGRVFRGVFQLNDPCPVCGELFQREEGTFLGTMYVSYALGAILVAVAYFAAAAVWPDVSPVVICLWLFAAYVPLIPLIHRYSWVLWLHLDYLVSSSEASAGSFEKARRRDLNTRGPTSRGSRGGPAPPG
jgi:uncharacterized protein (DUF983 family)